MGSDLLQGLIVAHYLMPAICIVANKGNSRIVLKSDLPNPNGHKARDCDLDSDKTHEMSKKKIMNEKTFFSHIAWSCGKRSQSMSSRPM